MEIEHHYVSAIVNNDRLLAYQMVTPIFIAAIALINVIFFGTTVRWIRLASKPKCLLTISLAIGDILTAAFCLVVVEWSLFKTSFSGSDIQVLKVASIFLYFFDPFIYGSGLCFLCAELIMRKELKYKDFTSTDVKNILLSVGCMLLPWALAFCLVLPVILHAPVASFGVAVCLPATVAAVMGVTTRVLDLDPLLPVQVEVLDSPPSSPSSHQPQERSMSSSETVPTTMDVPEYPADHPVPMRDLSYEGSSEHKRHDSALEDQRQISLYSLRTLREQDTLLMISVINFLCVMPYGIYMQIVMGMDSDWTNHLEGTFLPDLFYWLMIFRPFITPLVWTRKARDMKKK